MNRKPLPAAPPNKALGISMPSIRSLTLGDNPHGYHVEWDPQGGPLQEYDTYTCAHHQHHFGGYGVGELVIVKRGTPQAWCKRCGGMVCEACAPHGACNPETNPNRDEFMEACENRHRLRRIIDLGHG